jgi:hypothetical protein
MHKDIKWANKELKGLSHDKLNELTAQKLTRIENGKQTIANNSSFEGRSKGGQTNVETGHIQSIGKEWGQYCGKKYGKKNGKKVAATGLGTKAAIKVTSIKVVQLTMDGKIVKVWNSMQEAGRNGFNVSQISAICNNKPKMKTHKGFLWKFEK